MRRLLPLLVAIACIVVLGLVLKYSRPYIAPSPYHYKIEKPLR